MSKRKKSKSRKSRSRKRQRVRKLDDNLNDTLKGMGFSQDQIDEISNDIDPKSPFDSALELLLIKNKSPQKHPPRKKRKKHHHHHHVPVITIDDDDDDDEDVLVIDNDHNRNINQNHNTHSSEEEKKDEQPKTEKKTHAQIKEEEFDKQNEEMNQHETEYKQWEITHDELENVISSIRDNINNLYNDRPKLPHDQSVNQESQNLNNNNNDSKNDEKDNENDNNVTMEDLLTERMKLKEIINWAFNSMSKHVKFCNEKLDELFVEKEIKKQNIVDERFKFQKSKQEFESEKYALELMQNEVNSGQNKMTLVEHNLFIVANAINNNEENVNNDRFKQLNDKIFKLQNKDNLDDTDDANSNSKREMDENADDDDDIDEHKDDKKEEVIEFECKVCFCGYSSLDEILIFDECYHFYCINCLNHMMKVKIEDRNVKNIKCLDEKCEHILSNKEMSYILSKEDYIKYDEYLLDKTLQSAKDCRFCPAPDCGTAMFGYSDSPMLSCPKCGKQFCFNCGTEEWHEGVTCEAFKTWKEENGQADAKFDEWAAQQGAQKCPQCNSMIEKNGGCDHMTCKNCKYEFHWITGEKWRGYGARYNVPRPARGRPARGRGRGRGGRGRGRGGRGRGGRRRLGNAYGGNDELVALLTNHNNLGNNPYQFDWMNGLAAWNLNNNQQQQQVPQQQVPQQQVPQQQVDFSNIDWVGLFGNEY